MAGFENGVVVAKNVNFDEAGAKPHLGVINAAGKLAIGTGNSSPTPEILGGSITSPLGTITVGYSSPNITLDLAGGGAAIDEIAVQTGTSPIVPTAGGLVTINGATVAAGTNPVRTDGTGANTMAVEVQISQAIASTNATNIGLSAFNSAQFTVDANGFVSITNGGFAWNDISGAFSPLKNNGYIATATANGSLPAAPAQGDTIKFYVDHASQLLTITANTGQVIRMGTMVSSSAGTVVSTQRGDSCELVFRSTGNVWMAINFVGAWNNT